MERLRSWLAHMACGYETETEAESESEVKLTSQFARLTGQTGLKTAALRHWQ